MLGRLCRCWRRAMKMPSLIWKRRYERAHQDDDPLPAAATPVANVILIANMSGVVAFGWSTTGNVSSTGNVCSTSSTNHWGISPHTATSSSGVGGINTLGVGRADAVTSDGSGTAAGSYVKGGVEVGSSGIGGVKVLEAGIADGNCIKGGAEISSGIGLCVVMNVAA